MMDDIGLRRAPEIWTRSVEALMSGNGVLDPGEVQKILAVRAESIRCYLDRKIPARVRSTLSAEDVLQEVWLAAFQSLTPEVRDPDRWLMTLANSKLVDALRAGRRLKRGGHETIISAAQQRSSYDDLLTRLDSRQRTPSREVSAQEARHAVQIAMSALPEDRRQAVQLRHIEGRSRKEVAEIMNKTEAAVNSLLFRGLNELRGRVGDIARLLSDAGPTESSA